jgi:Membrane bound beta barrel domain (DUF5777)
VTRCSSVSFTFCLLIAFALASASPARAQSTPTQAPAAAASAAQQSASDDDGSLDPMEPDYSLISLPTTLRLPKHRADFHLTHRFDENLVCSEGEEHCFSNRAATLFGLDAGANIGLEFRWAPARHWQAVFHRTTLGQEIQLALQYDAWHQNAEHPVSISGLASIAGDHNFGASTPDGSDTQWWPALGLLVSRKIANRIAVYAEPFWVHHTSSQGLPVRDTGFVGLGGRLRLSSTVNFVGEVAPRIGGLAIRNPQFGFALEKRIGGHVFSLTLTNNPGTTFRQIASGGNPDTLNLGFNLSRKFF